MEEFQSFFAFELLNILNSKLLKAQVTQTSLSQLWVPCSLQYLRRWAKSF